jgi:hypothetical protein
MMVSKAMLHALAVLLLSVLVPPRVAAQFAPGFSNPGCNDDVLALTLYDGDLIAGGRFTEAGGVPVQRIARWDGSMWHPLGEGIAGQQEYSDDQGNSILFDPHILALTVYQDQLIAGGSFTTAGGQDIATVARWDGTTWSALGEGITESVTIQFGGSYYTFPPLVTSLAVWNGRLYAGGLFQTAGGIWAERIASWDGESWQPLSWGVRGGYPARVLVLAAAADYLSVGGEFTHADTMQVRHTARWDGSDWHAFQPEGMDGQVLALALYESDVIAGGAFTSAGGMAANHIARWNGSTWEPLGEGIPNPVHVIIAYGDDLFAGSFRWTGQSWLNELGANAAILAATVYRGRLVVGGEFTSLAGEVRRHIGAWPSEESPVFLAYFTAQRQGEAALLNWALSESGGPHSFHVWRQEANGSRRRLSEQPITGGPSYEFLDPAAPRGEAQYWLQYEGDDGSTSWLGQVALAEAQSPPDPIYLAQNQPNPFNPRTALTFKLPRPAWVRLSIHDVRGQLVALLIDDWMSGGEHSAAWNGRWQGNRRQEAAAGVYIARLETAAGVQARKITLAR